MKHFNSQIFTTLNQSKRLINLGLNFDTADCSYIVEVKDFHGREIPEKQRCYIKTLGFPKKEELQIVGLSKKEVIPAWSLSRLIEMLPPYISSMDAVLVINKDGVSYESDYISGGSKYFQEDYGLFQNIICCIEWLIKEEGKLKTYLNEKA